MPGAGVVQSSAQICSGSTSYSTCESVLGAECELVAAAGGPLPSHGGDHSPRAFRMASIRSSWTGELMAETTFILAPHLSHNSGSHNHTLRMS